MNTHILNTFNFKALHILFEVKIIFLVIYYLKFRIFWH